MKGVRGRSTRSQGREACFGRIEVREAKTEGSWTWVVVGSNFTQGSE